MTSITLHGVPSLVALSPSDRDARPHLELLVRRLRERDARLIERVLRELLPLVRRWAFRLLGPHPELDDAVQDALSEIAGALHRFEGRSSVATLAHKIVLRRSYRFFRRRSGWSADSIDLDELEDDEPDPEKRALAREIATRVYACLESLPPLRRAAFVLCAIEGMGPTEAAEIAGCSPVAMRSRLHHARAELEARMREDELLAPLFARRSS
jgi:RNA polymerase sigma-70 factor (ECF subfamily)